MASKVRETIESGPRGWSVLADKYDPYVWHRTTTLIGLSFGVESKKTQIQSTDTELLQRRKASQTCPSGFNLFS